MRRRLRGNPARVQGAMRRLLVRVQSLILIHGGTSQARHSEARCANAPAALTCALCDLEKAEWRRLLCDLGVLVPVERAFRDTASGPVLSVCRSFPSIVAQTLRSHELLLDTDALEGCAGSVRALREAIRRSARVRGLDVF
jgi:hypothetical protein